MELSSLYVGSRKTDGESILRPGDRGRYIRDDVVFVSVAQLVQKPKRMPPTEIPSMVWLRQLNDYLVVSRKMPDSFASFSLEVRDKPSRLAAASVSSSNSVTDHEDRKLGLGRAS